MNNSRIKSIYIYNPDSECHTVQKRLFGFLWWRNVYSYDGYDMRVTDNYVKAMTAHSKQQLKSEGDE